MVLIIISLTVLTACGEQNTGAGSSEAGQNSEEKVLTISWLRDVGELNPHLYSPNEMFAQAFLYEPLVNYGEGGVIETFLAKDWEISPDGLEYVDKLVVKIIPDGEARVIAFERGEIDLIFGSGLISLDSYVMLKEDDRYHAIVSEPLATRAIAVNSNKGATKELNVRQAISHAFNKQAVIDLVFFGTETKADTLLSPNFPYSDLGLTPFDYDVKKAEALLDEAGWILPDGKDIREKNGQPQLVFAAK